MAKSWIVIPPMRVRFSSVQPMKYSTVYASAPTWMDIKMRDFERSHYTNAPMFEPLVTDYYKKTWTCYCGKVNYVGQDCRICGQDQGDVPK